MSITDDVRATEPRPSEGRGGGPRDAERTGGDGQFDRTPPQDVAAEQCVLGGMLLSKDAIADVVEILRTGDFYRPNHGVIFDAILDLYGRGEPADPARAAPAAGGRDPGPLRAGRGCPAGADGSAHPAVHYGAAPAGCGDRSQ